MGRRADEPHRRRNQRNHARDHRSGLVEVTQSDLRKAITAR
jgi:hypothetical protein